MLDDVVGSFLDSVNERELDAPIMALLRSQGFKDIHLVHGSFEFGKDLIAKRADPTPTQYVFQTKAGDIGLPRWTTMRGQIDLLRTNELSHPSFDRALPRAAVLVLSGRLVGGAPLEVQDYQRQAGESDGAPLEVWDRERLIELMAASPETGLAGSTEGEFLELVARIDSGRVTETDVERFSRRWIAEGQPSGWRSFLEAAIVANRLRQAERLDLACFTSLALLRGVWASVHAIQPPPKEAVDQADLARAMFVGNASELWALCKEEDLDPKALIGGGNEGIFLTYLVRCTRLLEVLGAFGLTLGGEDRAELSSWLGRFLGSQPGAAHPISDRWAVSLLPAVLLARETTPEVIEPYLREVVRWLGNHYEGDALGLAAYDASPKEEAEYVLGGSLEHIDHPKRRSSYLASVVLDLSAVLELPAVYDVAFNDIEAVDATPLVPLPNDDLNQYLVSGSGVNVPVNTSPKYAEHWSEGEEWRMASHHDDDLARYYLGRIGRLWDALAISLVTRDRHWVALLAALTRARNGEPPHAD